MSSYFDNAASEISKADNKNDDEFFEAARQIENKVVKDCLLNSGDKDFPEDLRQKIVGHVALWNLGYTDMSPIPKAKEWLLSLRSSKLINLLHEDFHDVAQRRIETRFGRLSDNPAHNLAHRDQHIAEKEKAKG